MIAGTFSAIILTPDEVEAAGNARLPALVLALSLVVVPFRLAFSAPASIFHPVTVLAGAPAYWLLLDPIQGAYDLVSITAEEVRLSFLMICLFSSGVWIASFGRPWRLPAMVREAVTLSPTSRSLFGIGVIAFTFAFLRFAIPSGFSVNAMIDAFSGSRWEAPWARGALGGWNAILDHFGYFGYLLPPLTAVLARQTGWRHRRTLVMIVLSFIILGLSSIDGGRRIIGAMLGSGMVAYFLSARRPGGKDLAVIGLACAGLLAFMQVMLTYRGLGLAAAFSHETRVDGQVEHLHVDDNFLRLAEIIHIMPDQHPHVGSKWLVWLAVRPVPRVLWSGKPMDPGFELSVYQEIPGVSLTMSLVGELYMAFGALGCVGGGILLGSVANALAQVMESGPTPGALITFGAGLLALFAGMRSGIELVLMSYGLLAWIGLVWAYRRLRA